jgi:hypothetical protein
MLATSNRDGPSGPSPHTRKETDYAHVSRQLVVVSLIAALLLSVLLLSAVAGSLGLRGHSAAAPLLAERAASAGAAADLLFGALCGPLLFPQ